MRHPAFIDTVNREFVASAHFCDLVILETFAKTLIYCSYRSNTAIFIFAPPLKIGKQLHLYAKTTSKCSFESATVNLAVVLAYSPFESATIKFGCSLDI